MLPNVYHSTEPDNIIMSITQNKNSTFLESSSNSDANRMIRCLRRMKLIANFSYTYSYVFKEEARSTKREIIVKGNHKNNIKIQRTFEDAGNSHDAVHQINLGMVRNLHKFRSTISSGTWKLMLVKCDSSDDEN